VNRVALLVPGLEYTPDRPLLRAAGDVFRRHGWTVREFRWSSPPPPRAGQDFPVWFARLRAFVAGQLESAPAAGALAGKSMGAFAASLAADRGLPGIWLTPPLRDSPLARDLRRATKPYLLVGSAADPSWERVAAEHVYEAPDADHDMEVPGDPDRSARVLREVTAAMDGFVGTLGRRGRLPEVGETET
jgi:hypothetical protein